MIQLQDLKFKDTNVMATESAKGTIWFKASDVATALGFKNQYGAIKNHCKDAIKRTIELDVYHPNMVKDTPLAAAEGGVPNPLAADEGVTCKQNIEVTLIPEWDVYSLIFAAARFNKKADEFKDWVTKEVLPSIRKTGGYIAPNASSEQLIALKNKVISLEVQNKALELKACTHNQEVKADGLMQRLEAKLGWRAYRTLGDYNPSDFKVILPGKGRKELNADVKIVDSKYGSPEHKYLMVDEAKLNYNDLIIWTTEDLKEIKCWKASKSMINNHSYLHINEAGKRQLLVPKEYCDTIFVE